MRAGPARNVHVILKLQFWLKYSSLFIVSLLMKDQDCLPTIVHGHLKSLISKDATADLHEARPSTFGPVQKLCAWI